MAIRRSMVVCALLCAVRAIAVAQAGSDVPKEHWAYQAIQDLAVHGLIKGYPPRGDILGNRAATRYEMASIVLRVLERVDEIYARKGEAGKPTETVRPEQLDEIRSMSEEFRKELIVIGGDLKQAEVEIADLRGQVSDARKEAHHASEDASAARREAAAAHEEIGGLRDMVKAVTKDEAGVAREQRSHKIGGYIQGRFDMLEPGNSALFPAGGAGGTGQTPSLGAPSVGGGQFGFLLRRVRLKVSGPIAARSSYLLQIDAQSIGAPSLYDAYVDIADLPLKQMVGRFGQFTPPFGYELFTPSSIRESPERAFGFGVNAADYPIFKTTVSATGGTLTPGSVIPLFVGQNRDVGGALSWASTEPPSSQTRATLAVINGEGRAASGVRNTNQSVDLVGRVEKGFLNGNLGLGASGYYGSLSVRGGPPAGNPATPVAFTNAYRMLAGADIRYTTPWGTSIRGEYVGGIFETTPDRSQYLKNNHVYAWYVTARQPVSRRLDFVSKYDEYYPISAAGVTAGGLGRMQLVRKSVGGGLMYRLDEATRLRLWYVKGLTPYDPSAVSGPLRSRLGLITSEVQVIF